MVSDTNNVYSLQYNFMASFIKETNIEFELLVQWYVLFLLYTFPSLSSRRLCAAACGGHCSWLDTEDPLPGFLLYAPILNYSGNRFNSNLESYAFFQSCFFFFTSCLLFSEFRQQVQKKECHLKVIK